MKINIKEPYKTFIVLSVTTSVLVGIVYIAMPNKYRLNINKFFSNKFKLGNHDGKMEKPTNLG